jgi:ABC-type phosphate transport system permease subunit
MDQSEELLAKGIEGGLVRKSRSLVSLYTRRRLVNVFNLGMSLLTTAFGLFWLIWLLWTLLHAGLPALNWARTHHRREAQGDWPTRLSAAC